MQSAFRISVLVLASTAAALILSGCPAALMHDMSNQQPQNAGAGQAGAAARPSQPYGLEAHEIGGTLVEFNITNSGSTAIPVNRRDIMLLDPRSRQQYHYADGSADVAIELPPNCVIPAGGHVTGRARFADAQAPAGMRLVFNPGADARAKNAVVTTIRSSEFAAAAAAQSAASAGQAGQSGPTLAPAP